jgi:hypothetical protein
MVLGLFACGEPIDDGEDEVVDRIDLAAPLAFELAPGARLVLEDATVVGVGTGTVIIDALAVDASAGAIFELPLAEGTTALRLAGPNGSRRIAAARRPEIAADAHVVDARVEGLELGGFDAAWLVDASGERIELDEPLVVDANALAWTAGELVMIELPDDDAAAANGGGGASGSGARRRGPVGAPGDPDELAHVRGQDGDGGPFPDEIVGEIEPELLEPGDPCSATAQCPIETRCVADPMMSDGQFRCLALCVEPELVGGPMPPLPSPSATCVDDSSCCDPSLACSNGQCGVVDPEDDDGGQSEIGSSCDRDGDGWVNGCDRKPDESCTADSDGDGCNDSFDDNDEDNCQCTTPVRLPRPNSTGIALMVLIWMRGRTKR